MKKPSVAVALIVGMSAAAGMVACGPRQVGASMLPGVPMRVGSPVLRSTFPPGLSALPSQARPFVGRWISTDRRTDLVIAPRTPVAGRPSDRELYGSIAGGPFEGALSFPVTALADGLTLDGSFLRFDHGIRRETATISLQDHGLVLITEAGERAHLSRLGSVNLSLLHNVSIIGHRGGSALDRRI